MKLELTQAEAQNLVTLMDAAVRAGGLNAAVLAAPLFAKLQEEADEAACDADIPAG